MSNSNIDKILDRLAVRMYDEGQLDKPSLIGRQVAIVNINEAKQAIQQELLKARIAELEEVLRRIGAEYDPMAGWYDEIKDRIADLQKELKENSDE